MEFDLLTRFHCSVYFLAIAEALGSKVCVTNEKRSILDCLEDSRINALITPSKIQAKVHVLKMGQLRYEVK